MNLRGILSGILGRERDSSSPVSPPSTASAEIATARQERRAFPRRYGDPVEVRLRSYEFGDPPCGPTGWVRDRCPGGLGLAVEKPLVVGTWLRVRPTHVMEDVPWVDLIVRHCHPQGNRWVVGCQFVEKPPRELMLLFR